MYKIWATKRNYGQTPTDSKGRMRPYCRPPWNTPELKSICFWCFKCFSDNHNTEKCPFTNLSVPLRDLTPNLINTRNTALAAKLKVFIENKQTKTEFDLKYGLNLKMLLSEANFVILVGLAYANSERGRVYGEINQFGQKRIPTDFDMYLTTINFFLLRAHGYMLARLHTDFFNKWSKHIRALAKEMKEDQIENAGRAVHIERTQSVKNSGEFEDLAAKLNLHKLDQMFKDKPCGVGRLIEDNLNKHNSDRRLLSPRLTAWLLRYKNGKTQTMAIQMIRFYLDVLTGLLEIISEFEHFLCIEISNIMHTEIPVVVLDGPLFVQECKGCGVKHKIPDKEDLNRLNSLYCLFFAAGGQLSNRLVILF